MKVAYFIFHNLNIKYNDGQTKFVWDFFKGEKVHKGSESNSASIQQQASINNSQQWIDNYSSNEQMQYDIPYSQPGSLAL